MTHRLLIDGISPRDCVTISVWVDTCIPRKLATEVYVRHCKLYASTPLGINRDIYKR